MLVLNTKRNEKQIDMNKIFFATLLVLIAYVDVMAQQTRIILNICII
jgi:hypothetical protein